jgi:hypothetical protein
MTHTRMVLQAKRGIIVAIGGRNAHKAKFYPNIIDGESHSGNDFLVLPGSFPFKSIINSQQESEFRRFRLCDHMVCSEDDCKVNSGPLSQRIDWSSPN